MPKCKVKNPKLYKKLRSLGYSEEKAARIANAGGGKRKKKKRRS